MGILDNKVVDIIRDWANDEDKVRRVWLHEITTEDTDSSNHLSIAVELEPVNDSEEELLLWMSKSREWQTYLQKTVPTEIQLEWVDPYNSTGVMRTNLNEKYTLVYDRTGELSAS